MTCRSQIRFLAGITLMLCLCVVGCQTSGKFRTAWKDRKKANPKFQASDSREDVTYWPYVRGNKNEKMTAIPKELKEKIALKSEKTKRESEVVELMKEGDLHRRNNQLDDARTVYMKALAVAPDNPDLFHRLAIVADLQGQFAVADEYYQKTLYVRPRDVDVLSDRGYSYMIRGNMQQAEMALREALLVDPAHKGAMANLGSLLARQNRYDEALAMFRQGSTEAEAQQRMAQFFPNGATNDPSRVLPASAQGHAGGTNAGVTTAGNVQQPQIDLSKLSFEEIQAEMKRRALESKQRRSEAEQRQNAQWQAVRDEEERLAREAAEKYQTRGMQANANFSRSAETPVNGQMIDKPDFAPANRQAMNDLPPAANNSAMRMQPPPNGVNPSPREGRPAEIYRGPSALAGNGNSAAGTPGQNRQGWNSGAGGTSGNVQPANYSHRTALQLGMNVGPGGMFPVVPQASDPYASPSGFPNQPGADSSAAGSTPETDGNRKEFPDELGPQSPNSGWGTPGTDTSARWQNMTELPPWANEIETSNRQSGDLNWMNESKSTWGQSNDQPASDGFENVQQALRSMNQNQNQPQNANENRPYNGSWPNAGQRQNELPNRGPSAFSNTNQFGSVPANSSTGMNMPAPSGSQLGTNNFSSGNGTFSSGNSTSSTRISNTSGGASNFASGPGNSSAATNGTYTAPSGFQSNSSNTAASNYQGNNSTPPQWPYTPNR